ncbi:hypothetical protein PsorP6_005239 [Peronosclerospora sorghi]|uniref:Uncharacterized protein n=1 Tax=Peronosclerospora sorghi TaxID=230839 RepID=A0ACC0W2L2_9STRA|nr:hypothetical protein PsorP6_005239 [Peronosclerospora sorghi]
MRISSRVKWLGWVNCMVRCLRLLARGVVWWSQGNGERSESSCSKSAVLEKKLVQYFDDHEALAIESMDNGQCLETPLQPLTPSLTESIERDVAALV